MRVLERFAIIALSCVLWSEDAAAGELVTDVNIVTAIDISDSIDSRAMQVEIDGMAAAILAPDVINAIQDGRHHRIGFAVFAWRDGAFPEFVSWTTIETKEDAAIVSNRLRSGFRAFAASDPPSLPYAPRMTDLSGAIDHAAILLLSAPYAADRSVINVIGNGWDNVGEGPRAARDRVIATGGTINGVVLGFDPVLMSYYRGNVIGGPSAFLLSVSDPTAMTDVLARKFLYDIALHGEDGELDSIGRHVEAALGEERLHAAFADQMAGANRDEAGARPLHHRRDLIAPFRVPLDE
jgi:Ca-activated chloride channel homolog